MNILVVTECFWPDIYAVNDIVESLVKRGHQVTVLTGLPDYTTSKIPPEYKHGKNRHHKYKGADVYRVSTIARHHGPIWRSLSYLSFALNGSLKARFHDFIHTDVWYDGFDVIYVWEVSPVTMAIPAITLKKRYHKPLFLYCMDIWPECVKAMSIREGTLAFKLIHAWSKRIYGQCDHIAVSSKPFFEYLENINGVKRDKMSYLPQFGDSTLLEADTGKRITGDLEKSGSIPVTAAPYTTTDFLFIGNIGKAQNIETLIRAMTVFKKPLLSGAHLHIVGGGSDFDRIRVLTTELDLDDLITFYGPVPFKESLEFYLRADACVLTIDGSTRIGDTLPGKLQTYMAAGKPVIAAAGGATAQIIEEADCGICVPAGDHDALGRAMYQFAYDTAVVGLGTKSTAQTGIPTYGANARAYFRDHFMEEQHFANLEEEFKDLCHQNNYILEISWGCPSKRYPLNGIFQFDQAAALRDIGINVVFGALDLRSVRRWRKWGVSRREHKGIPVYEYSFPCGPLKPDIKYRIQDSGFTKLIAQVEKRYGKPAVIHVHTCQQAISVKDYCDCNDIPYVITEHITPLDEGGGIELRKKTVLHDAKQVIAVSNALGRDLKRVYDVDSITIPNIVDLSEFKYNGESKNDTERVTDHTISKKRFGDSDEASDQSIDMSALDHPIRFISAASMNYGKGFDVLIKAYASLIGSSPGVNISTGDPSDLAGRYHLTIMGDGPEALHIKQMASELSIPGQSITFTGTYTRDEFARELAISDIFVLPSRSETFGLVYAEALASGVPVIATKCGGPEDYIDDTNGILVSVDDVEALACAMRTMAGSIAYYDREAVSMACKDRFDADKTAHDIAVVLDAGV